jgi:hypothetical protein
MRYALILIAAAIASGCTARVIDNKLTPQLMSNGDVVYVYSNLAGPFQKESDKDAEATRLLDLKEWMTDANLCPAGYEIAKRQVIANFANTESKRIYYFVRCK